MCSIYCFKILRFWRVEYKIVYPLKSSKGSETDLAVYIYCLFWWSILISSGFYSSLSLFRLLFNLREYIMHCSNENEIVGRLSFVLVNWEEKFFRNEISMTIQKMASFVHHIEKTGCNIKYCNLDISDRFLNFFLRNWICQIQIELSSLYKYIREQWIRVYKIHLLLSK